MWQFLKRQIDRVIDRTAERTAERVVRIQEETAERAAASVTRAIEESSAHTAQAMGELTWQTIERVVVEVGNQVAERVAKETTGSLEELVSRMVAYAAEQTIPELAAAFDALIEQAAEITLRKVGDQIGHLVRLRSLLGGAAGRTPQELFGSVDDDYWLWLNTEGLKLSPELRAILPGLPEERLQLEAVALKGQEAVRHGFSVYRLFKGLFEKHRGPLASCEAILDFGCGWGRVLRFFLKDLAPSKLWGVDAWDEMIGAARRVDRWCHYEPVDSLGPTPFADDRFDCVYGHSVFSHLPEDVHTRWLAEFRRILRPGGLLIATTRGRDFIEDIEQLRKNGIPPETDALVSGHYRALMRLFSPAERALASYDRGEFCFDTCPEYGGIAGLPAYGEACISRGYVANHWTRYFTLLDYLDDRALCEQNVIVMRKPQEAPRDGREA